MVKIKVLFFSLVLIVIFISCTTGQYMSIIFLLFAGNVFAQDDEWKSKKIYIGGIMVYCIEIYKTAYKMNGREVMRLFDQYEVLDYITKCYGALHTTGPEYIIEDITSYIEERK
jgi:general stress protein CsbA